MADLEVSPLMKEDDYMAWVTYWIGPIYHLFISFIHFTIKS
jgi:hypothetical protein